MRRRRYAGDVAAIKASERTAPGPCHYCGRDMLTKWLALSSGNPDLEPTRDHLVPRHLSPVNVNGESNVVLACRGCNEIKAGAPANVFRYFLRHCEEKKRKPTKGYFNVFCYRLLEKGLIAQLQEDHDGGTQRD